jgi:Ribbon-helix-helix protein, copG family.
MSKDTKPDLLRYLFKEQKVRKGRYYTKRVRIVSYIDRDMRQKLKEISFRHRVSVSEIVRQLLSKFIEEYEKEFGEIRSR